MSKPFTIESEPARGLLRLTLGGFWTGETLLAFAAAVHDAASALPCGLGNQRVVVMLTGWPVQSQELFAALLAYLRDAEPKARRVALVTQPGLTRLQARRLLDPGYMAMFDREEDARAWVLAEGETR